MHHAPRHCGYHKCVTPPQVGFIPILEGWELSEGAVKVAGTRWIPLVTFPLSRRPGTVGWMVVAAPTFTEELRTKVSSVDFSEGAAGDDPIESTPLGRHLHGLPGLLRKGIDMAYRRWVVKRM